MVVVVAHRTEAHTLFVNGFALVGGSVFGILAGLSRVSLASRRGSRHHFANVGGLVGCGGGCTVTGTTPLACAGGTSSTRTSSTCASRADT